MTNQASVYISVQTGFGDLNMSWSERLLAFDRPSKVAAAAIAAELNLAPKLKESKNRTNNALDTVSSFLCR
jgi:hypothetical protein